MRVPAPSALICLAAFVLASTFAAGCGNAGRLTAPETDAGPPLVDQQATPETRALYGNLLRLMDEGQILFGQQDATAYGVGWWPEAGEPAATTEARADIRRVSGDYPAVYGWNVAFAGIRPLGVDSVDFGRMRELVLAAYRRGGVNTFAWHAPNPATGGGAGDTTRVMGELLPGGQHHVAFRAQLDGVAGYFETLRPAPDASPIPLIFRPFHEHNGSWFWWGQRHATPEEFVAVWRYTVEYLRDERGLHNVLYAYSPDLFEGRAEYLERYPGDAYVDVLGFDDYYDFYGEGRSPQLFTEQMRVVAGLAQEKGKVAALTEFGLDGITDPDWYTTVFLPALRADALGSRIAYMMTWRNARPSHHYVPYPGHPAVEDFRTFLADPSILMGADAPGLYRPHRRR